MGWLIKLFKGAQSPDATAKELQPPNVMVSKKFLSDAEVSFYRVLTLCLDNKTTILAQVSLQQLFSLKGPGRQQTWQNKIRSRSIDFLLCDTATLRPILGIELDDVSHERPERVNRDLEVDRIFQAAKLPLLHIPAQRQYDTRKLTQQIQDCLK